MPFSDIRAPPSCRTPVRRIGAVHRCEPSRTRKELHGMGAQGRQDVGAFSDHGGLHRATYRPLWCARGTSPVAGRRAVHRSRRVEVRERGSPARSAFKQTGSGGAFACSLVRCTRSARGPCGGSGKRRNSRIAQVSASAHEGTVPFSDPDAVSVTHSPSC